MEQEEFKQLVYDLMQGDIDLSRHPLKESKIVANEFADGKKCEVAYADIYAAKERLLNKLKVGEDKDLESILDNFDIICKELCLKIYDYAILFHKEN